MHFLIDENISKAVVVALRERGHDVSFVKEEIRGAADKVVLSKAMAENKVLVTRDKDFGALAFTVVTGISCGIILLRFVGNKPETDKRRIVEVMESRNDWAGNFSVVTETEIRVRPLPK